MLGIIDWCINLSVVLDFEIRQFVFKIIEICIIEMINQINNIRIKVNAITMSVKIIKICNFFRLGAWKKSKIRAISIFRKTQQ